jgi:amino acid adenylation domain-containing protein
MDAHPLTAAAPDGAATTDSTGLRGNSTLGLHELVERQAARTPAAVAVLHDRRRVSFARLDAMAEALAERLSKAGVRADDRVAVCLEPSVELVVTLLAVLKSGACFVPLAPDAPAHRVRQILSAARPRIAVAVPDSARLLRDADSEVVVVPPWGGPARRRRTTRRDVNHDQLAYIMFTSGSTGEPKGVMVPHRGICNTLAWRQRRFPFGPGDRVLLTFSIVFDASLFEIFQPLVAGACLVIPKRGLDGDPALTIAAVRRNRISVLGVVPTLLDLLLQEADLGACRSLRLIFCGGEKLSAETVFAVRRTLSAELVNVYGPTEASIEASYWVASSPLPLSIGQPIDNVDAHVLCGDLEPAAIGETGELFLSGPGLARGYLEDPRLTAERFLPEPFSGTAGTRMYRTGDLCRWRNEGCLEYLGRTDDQVKLRGVRVELGEIETAVAGHPDVRQAAVAVDRDGAGQRVVAYLVPVGSVVPTVSALRGFLSDRLPRAALPSTVVAARSLPRTVSGKLDRAALAGLGERSAEGGTAPVVHDRSDPVERHVRDLWARTLQMANVPMDADFFDLGGSSVQAAIVAHRLEDTLGEFFYPMAIYDAPTVIQLAEYIRVNYSSAAAERWGIESTAADVDRTLVEDSTVDRLRAAVRRLPDRNEQPSRLGPVVFVLSPPRSGSTLLRVVLGVHPGLFAPPELQLLNFDTLRHRRGALAGERDRFWLQGTVRALMELHGCTVEEATRRMAEYEDRDLTVHGFYAELQGLLGERLLVDKTPTYALDPSTLHRAEQDFADAQYLHLVRNPEAAVASFQEAQLHTFFPAFFTSDPRLSPRQLAESVWTLSHCNIVDFLHEVPPGRRHVVRYEELVTDPAGTIGGITDFLGLPFDAAMVRPYEQDQRRLMTDAVHPLARSLGDVKFPRHGGIRAERAAPPGQEVTLHSSTSRLAVRLGYTTRRRSRDLVDLQGAGNWPAIFCVHPAAGTANCYLPLARALNPQVGLWAFHHSVPTFDTDPVDTVEGLAARYLHELLTVQPNGPYHLLGWSFGGLVAFEMAKQLTDRGLLAHPPVLVGAHLPPVEQRPMPSPREFSLRALREGLVGTRGETHGALTDLTAAFRAARLGGLLTVDQTYDEFIRVVDTMELTYQRHVVMARAYQPAGQLPGLTLLDPSDASLDDPGTFPSWTTVAQRVERITVPGNHFSVLAPPGLEVVARLLRRRVTGRPQSTGAVPVTDRETQ